MCHFLSNIGFFLLGWRFLVDLFFSSSLGATFTDRFLVFLCSRYLLCSVFFFRFLMTGVASFFSVTVEGSSRDAVMLAALAVRCEKRIGACVGGWL